MFDSLYQRWPLLFRPPSIALLPLSILKPLSAFEQIETRTLYAHTYNVNLIRLYSDANQHTPPLEQQCFSKTKHNRLWFPPPFSAWSVWSAEYNLFSLWGVFDFFALGKMSNLLATFHFKQEEVNNWTRLRNCISCYYYPCTYISSINNCLSLDFKRKAFNLTQINNCIIRPNVYQYIFAFILLTSFQNTVWNIP